jgi:hypothetical protein
METVTYLALTPDTSAKTTPLELLEDFADATPGWHYLEEESAHYADEKGVGACVLRCQRSGQPRYADAAFAAPDSERPQDLELILIDAPDPEHRIELESRNEIVDRFIDEMRSYLSDRPGHATLEVRRESVDPTKIDA